LINFTKEGCGGKAHGIKDQKKRRLQNTKKRRRRKIDDYGASSSK